MQPPPSPAFRSSLRLEIVLPNNLWNDKAFRTMTFIGQHAWVLMEDVRHLSEVPIKRLNIWKAHAWYLSHLWTDGCALVPTARAVYPVPWATKSGDCGQSCGRSIDIHPSQYALLFLWVDSTRGIYICTLFLERLKKIYIPAYFIYIYLRACWKKKIRGGQLSRSSAAVIHPPCWPIGWFGRQCSW